MKKFLAVFAVIALVAFAAPAFAANPFMDVPAGHWAYDAVAQLAASGVVSGYPDGAYKGARPATRYEMASIVARALAKVDAEKASKQDMEMLKKLVVEFKDELDALGVKVDKIDKRLAVIEDRLGGWKLRGQMYFDATYEDNDAWLQNAGRTDFRSGRARFFLTKQIDENTLFYSRFNVRQNLPAQNAWQTDRYYVSTKLPWDIDYTFGRFCFDWEGDLGFYDPYTVNNDATFGDWDTDGFQFHKAWGILDATAVIGRRTGTFDWVGLTNNEYMTYALNLKFTPNEKLFLGAMGYIAKADNDFAVGDVNTYGFYAGFNFTPSILLKGIYYIQDIDNTYVSPFTGGAYGPGVEDSPSSWKAILELDQDLLKFTSLWIEYAQEDNTFLGNNSYNYLGGNVNATLPFPVTGSNEMATMPFNNNTSKIFNIIANQEWNDKWSSYIRYFHADWDTANLDDTKDWTVGVRYQYTPAIQFKLEYDSIDYGNGRGVGLDKDNVLRFRTTVNF